MINKVSVSFEQKVYSALLLACEQELRNPPDEILHIVREYLINRNLLAKLKPSEREKMS